MTKLAPNTVVVVGATGSHIVTSPLVQVSPGSGGSVPAQSPPNHITTGGGFGTSENTKGEVVFDASFSIFPVNAPPMWHVYAWNNGATTPHAIQAIAECLTVNSNP